MQVLVSKLCALFAPRHQPDNRRVSSVSVEPSRGDLRQAQVLFGLVDVSQAGHFFRHLRRCYCGFSRLPQESTAAFIENLQHIIG